MCLIHRPESLFNRYYHFCWFRPFYALSMFIAIRYQCPKVQHIDDNCVSVEMHNARERPINKRMIRTTVTTLCASEYRHYTFLMFQICNVQFECIYTLADSTHSKRYHMWLSVIHLFLFVFRFSLLPFIFSLSVRHSTKIDLSFGWNTNTFHSVFPFSRIEHFELRERLTIYSTQYRDQSAPFNFFKTIKHFR